MITMIKREKLVRLFLIVGFLVVNGILTAEAQKLSNNEFESWTISAIQGRFMDGMRSYSLDSKGNLTEREGKNEITTKVNEKDLEEIFKLLQELNLPGAKTKTVKASNLWEGVHSGIFIQLDHKIFVINAGLHYKKKQVVLTATQKITLLKLQEKLAKITQILSSPVIQK